MVHFRLQTQNSVVWPFLLANMRCCLSMTPWWMDNVLSQVTGLFGKINEYIVSKKGDCWKGGVPFYFPRPESLFMDYAGAVARNWLMDIMQLFIMWALEWLTDKRDERERKKKKGYAAAGWMIREGERLAEAGKHSDNHHWCHPSFLH